jgi:hypothetical protein
MYQINELIFYGMHQYRVKLNSREPVVANQWTPAIIWEGEVNCRDVMIVQKKKKISKMDELHFINYPDECIPVMGEVFAFIQRRDS